MHLLARAVIIGYDGKVLLAQAEGHMNTFLPGGHVDPGESMVTALAREIAEELGAPCQVGAYLGAVEHQWPAANPTDYEVNHLFAVQAEVPAEPEALESHLRFRWCPADQLEAALLQPEPLRSLIPRYLRGDRSTWWASTMGAPKAE